MTLFDYIIYLTYFAAAIYLVRVISYIYEFIVCGDDDVRKKIFEDYLNNGNIL